MHTPPTPVMLLNAPTAVTIKALSAADEVKSKLAGPPLGFYLLGFADCRDMAAAVAETQDAELAALRAECAQAKERADFLHAATREAQEYAAKYADEVTGLRAECERLKAGLLLYAEGWHFDKADPDAWDTVSGEPENWYCDEAGTATVEDGSIARMVLDGKLTAEQIAAIRAGDSEDDPITPTERTP